eukprot:6653008-Lingulodinium_polyedra.AAC.1
MTAIQQVRREDREAHKEQHDTVDEVNQALDRFATDSGSRMVVSQQLPAQESNFHMIPSPNPSVQSFTCHYTGKPDVPEELAAAIYAKSRAWRARHNMVMECACPD